MSRRVALAVQWLLRIEVVRRLAAPLVRLTGGVASVARGYATLNPELAREVGVRSTCELTVDPPVPAPQADLDELPSETTPGERRFLYTFFAHLWNGKGNVVEVGPFIGGTTRAIALGMLANPLRDPASRLFTYDRFGSYYEPSELTEYLEPLFASGVLGKDERQAVAANARFDSVFEAVHRGTVYGDLVIARNRPVPDSQGEKGDASFDLDPGTEVGAVFVDGCKSWYATKYFMRRTLDATHVGSHVIFQDYGWYTCFWIPAFAHAMGTAMTLTAQVDATHAFHLRERVTAEVVDELFPDRAEDLGRDWFDDAFTALTEAAEARGDRPGAVVLRLQHAGALAYIGHLDEARALIDRVRGDIGPWGPNKYMVEQARVSPTFRQGGEPILLRRAR